MSFSSSKPNLFMKICQEIEGPKQHSDNADGVWSSRYGGGLFSFFRFLHPVVIYKLQPPSYDKCDNYFQPYMLRYLHLSPRLDLSMPSPLAGFGLKTSNFHYFAPSRQRSFPALYSAFRKAYPPSSELLGGIYLEVGSRK